MESKKDKKRYYTLVQHTGYSVGGHDTFARAVEERVIQLDEIATGQLLEHGVVLAESYK